MKKKTIIIVLIVLTAAAISIIAIKIFKNRNTPDRNYQNERPTGKYGAPPAD